MRLKTMNYKTFIFDCDGVILNSNKEKSNAFYQTVLAYGEDAAKELLDYHVCNGGISRYRKFEYFLKVIAPKYNTAMNAITIEELLNGFADQVKSALLSCEIASGLHNLRKITPDASWCIVSGGDQRELRDVFKTRQISELFDSGIFGSPDCKYSIIAREIANKNITQPAIFFGDSKLDHEVAASFDMDFIFISDWTEFKEWKTYCQENNISTVETINCLLDSFKLK